MDPEKGKKIFSNCKKSDKNLNKRETWDFRKNMSNINNNQKLEQMILKVREF